MMSVNNLTLPNIVEINKDKVIWSLSVPGQKDAYMSVRRSDNYWVVYVNAELFYQHWLANKRDHCVRRDLMQYDYKFSDAVRGFSHGRNNPVPLADISVYENRIGFTNGVTRTFWLLSNGCLCFPIKTDKYSHKALAELVGVGIPGIQACDIEQN